MTSTGPATPAQPRDVPGWEPMLQQMWSAVSDADSPLASTRPQEDVHGEPAGLPSALRVGDAAVAAITTALRAAAGLQAVRTGGSSPRIEYDAGTVAAAVHSGRRFLFGDLRSRPDGAQEFEPAPRTWGQFDELSRFWRTQDGWIRTHANYAWHAEALLGGLDVPHDVPVIERVLSAMGSIEAEERIVGHRGVAAALRTPQAWSEHEQNRVISARGLIDSSSTDGRVEPLPAPGDLPASGLRVLDLTRVVAGPVCSRFLAALGADVLRIDPPHLQEIAPHTYDGVLGKRSAFMDLREDDQVRRLHELLSEAHVVVLGYRPDALGKFGLDFDTLAARHPGLVVVNTSAWGDVGPWRGRRGFDSIVQVASGIALLESADGETPGVMPCQLLDYATGYLGAAAALEGLARRHAHGGTQRRTLSLARTARLLIDQGASNDQERGQEPDLSATDQFLDSANGPARVVAPPGSLDGAPLRWSRSLTSYGHDHPTWQR